HVFGLAQHLLALAVITQGTGFQHGRQADGGHRGVEISLRLDIGKVRGRNAEVLEHRLLEPAVTGDAQRLGARVHRDELREEGHGLGRHAFELEGHQIDIIGQAAQVLVVVVVTTQVLAQRLGTGVRRRIEEGETHAQRRTRQGQHAAQLAATDDTDLHSSGPCQERGSGFSSTVSVCSVRNCLSAAWNCGCWWPRMLAASSAALTAPALPMARVATGIPAGICTMDSSESTPESTADCTGTPSTGRWVLA